ncbi:MAG: polyprenyl synthetase family protein [Leptospiraceae bacterium]|nr:polyprenyl synthetase family protein [Leptospiraceae bacterium]
MSLFEIIKIPNLVSTFDAKLGEIIHEDLPILSKIKAHVIESGGKRIRPLTHYFLTQLLGYSGNEWKDVGAIAELIHGASLLHDDVVDGAELRRGKKTIGALHGNKTAILAGDYLLACGIEHLNKLHDPRLMDSYTRVIRDLAVGELIQMEWEKNPEITISIYEKVIYGKTASLFGAVAETAGILSKSDTTLVSELRNFGERMGMLFQKKDDYIDYFQDTKESGKILLKDFSNGLYTYPILLLLPKTKENEKKKIKTTLAKSKKNEKDFQFILEIMDNYSTKQTILSSLEEDVGFLLKFLSRFPSSSVKDLLVERIEGLLK